jgi:predicted nuclease of predicted toxin-antitoxin system
MRFMVDECAGPKLADWLSGEGHEVFSVYRQARGAEDDYVIRKAFDEGWILITNDKDFGEKIYRERRPHRGVVFMRLRNESASNKVVVMGKLLAEYSNKLANQFVVVTESRVRFGPA